MNYDNKIIELIREGDIKAFNVLFKSVYLLLYIYCRKFIPDAEDAKDILQNVFLRFWERRKDIDIRTSLNAYLYKAVQNECLNYLRSTKCFDSFQLEKSQISELGIIEENTPYLSCIVSEIECIADNTIEELPNQCKLIFKLSRVNGLKNQEIANELNISVRTVETQIQRALKILRGRLKDYLSS